MNKKFKNQIPEENFNSFDFLPFINKISHFGKWIIGGLILCLLIFFLFFRLSLNSTISSQTDFTTLEKELNSFLTHPDEAQQNQTLDKLTLLLKNHPELAPKYEGILAQILLNRRLVANALPFAEKALSEAKEPALSLFIDYSKTSLTIAQEKFKQALDEASELHRQFLNLSSPLKEEEALLFGFNLMRQAFLFEKIGDKIAEKKSWEAFNALPKKTYQQINDLFKEGQITLNDYIEKRMQLLNLSH